MTIWVGTGTSGGLFHVKEASVSALDHGFTVGDGIFETMKVVDGRVFLWPWHRERLHHSAQLLGIRLPSDEHLDAVIAQVIAGNPLSGIARIRLTISAGLGPLGSARDKVEPTVVCAMSPAPVRMGHARLHLVPWPRNERSPLAGVKSTSYAENVLALAHATERGFDEALFLNTLGNLCEGTASNVFVVTGGVVTAPPVSAGILAGVTRRFVLGLAGDGIEINEADVTAEDLRNANEVFITSTFQDVRAVSAIDERSVAPGPITAELARRFAARAAEGRYWS